MRILHTADWHLGRIFHGLHLTEDQAHVLEQLRALAREARPDAIIIAGDIFDRAMPPAEAVALLNDVLAGLRADADAHIIIIAGNHDSAERLGFGAPLLQAAKVHLCTHFKADPDPVVIDDAHGAVHLYPLPYAEPARARSETGENGLHDHADVFTHVLGNVRARLKAAGNPRAVVAAHATVLGGEPSDSERPLSIGGAEAVPPALFEGLSYVALGHLHRPQNVAENARYAGSLLKYSFSEAEHAKSISLVEIDAQGSVRVEEMSLTPRHDVRRISGTLEELLARAANDPAPDDYLLAEVTDEGPVLNALERLREAWPNVLRVERPWLSRMVRERAAQADHARITPVEMVEAFHRDMTGEPLSDTRRALLEEVLEELLRAQREEQA